MRSKQTGTAIDPQAAAKSKAILRNCCYLSAAVVAGANPRDSLDLIASLEHMQNAIVSAVPIDMPNN